MKINDLPEEVRILCERFPSSLATRLVLTTLTKKLCPELKETKDIGAFLVDVDGLAKPVKILPKFTNQATGRTRRNTDEETIEIRVDVSRTILGREYYSEQEYSNNTPYDVPVSVAAEGEQAIIDWLSENEELWSDCDYGDRDGNSSEVDDYENEEITIRHLDDVVSQAEERLVELNENN